METFSELGIDVRWKPGSQKVKCPNCREQRTDKSDNSLSVKLENGPNGIQGIYNCHYCGFSGFATQYKVEKMTEPKKNYAKPAPKKLTDLSANVIAWFAEKRGISETTLQFFKVTQAKEWMPPVKSKGIEAGERQVICFNYYRNKELINIKYRCREKAFKLVSGAELIFYNLDAVGEREDVVITEGEIDAMSFYESGITNAISVPNGAGQGSMKLEYLDNCWQHFEGKTKIILAVDGDRVGNSLKEELARRLGKQRVWTIQYPEGCKDANEVLLKYGPGAVRRMINQAEPWPLEGIETEDEIEDEMNDLYANGFPKGVGLGYPELDQLVRWRSGVLGGQIVIVIGESNSGKSAIIDQFAVRLAKQHGWKFAVFSFEQQPTKLHKGYLAQQYTGGTILPDSPKRMSQWQFEQAKEFIKEHFFFVKLEENDVSINGILAKVDELVVRKGVNAVIVDPWNEIEHKVPAGMTETNFVSRELSTVRKATKMLGLCYIQILHPVKPEYDKKTGKLIVPTLSRASGSNNFKNKADIGLSIYRDFQAREPGEAWTPDPVEVHVQKIRYDFDGRRGVSRFMYDLSTRRYTESGSYPEPVLSPDQPAEVQTEGQAGYRDPGHFTKAVTDNILGQWGLDNPQNDIPKEFKNNGEPEDEVPF